MRLRPLGATGIQVSPYCLGALMFGAWGNTDHEDSIRIIHRALDSGINIIDTADVYADGESEQIVGKALRGRRDGVVLATKFRGAMGSDPNRAGASRRWIVTAVEESLQRLDVDHIDLYQVHRPDSDTDLEETLSALTDLVRSGKIRAFGTSTYPASRIVEAQWIAERRGLLRCRTEQPPYSIVNRGIEREVLPVCERYGMGTLVWSPLAMGVLTGRYRRGRQTDSVRMSFAPERLTNEPKLAVVEKLLPLAAEAGMSLTHLAMAFAVAHPGVSTAIIGPRTMDQLDDLLAGADTALTDEVLDAIDAIVPPGHDVEPRDVAYDPPAIEQPVLRRRPLAERSAS